MSEDTKSLVLYAAVLKPNLDLFFSEIERRGDLDAAQSTEVDSVTKSLFQLDELMPAE